MTLTIPVPKGTRARDLNVVIKRKNLSVGLKGQDPLVSGELCKEIKLEDSTWTLREQLNSHPAPLEVVPEDQETVLVHLEKLNQQQWWENALAHHPKIDTTKIQPENSKLSDLDGETR